MLIKNCLYGEKNMPLLFISVILGGAAYWLYISLIKKKNKVREASSGIDVQLKKRYDLIPNLLQTAAKFMEHETKLLEDITRLRTEAMRASFSDNPEQTARAETELSAKLKEFNLSVENYPDLKSNQTMLQAMEGMKDAEEHIAAARRFYNAAVNDLNNAVEIFPSSLIAGILGIRRAVFFEIQENEKQEIKAGDYFK